MTTTACFHTEAAANSGRCWTACKQQQGFEEGYRQNKGKRACGAHQSVSLELEYEIILQGSEESTNMNSWTCKLKGLMETWQRQTDRQIQTTEKQNTQCRKPSTETENSSEIYLQVQQTTQMTQHTSHQASLLWTLSNPWVALETLHLKIQWLQEYQTLHLLAVTTKPLHDSDLLATSEQHMSNVPPKEQVTQP